MVELLAQQEVVILEEISQKWKKLYLGNGSSRYTFELSPLMCEVLGLPVKDITRYVVKMAVDFGGLRQNHEEIKCHQLLKEYTTQIRFVGQNVLVVERVTPFDAEYATDLYNSLGCGAVQDRQRMKELAELFQHTGVLDDDNCDAEHQESVLYDLCNQIDTVVDALTDVLGDTADNTQLGVSSDGRVISYDYGFNVLYSPVRDSCHETYVANIEFCGPSESALTYINILIKFLKGGVDAFHAVRYYTKRYL